jgi:hypothetical protein
MARDSKEAAIIIFLDILTLDAVVLLVVFVFIPL